MLLAAVDMFILASFCRIIFFDIGNNKMRIICRLVLVLAVFQSRALVVNEWGERRGFRLKGLRGWCGVEKGYVYDDGLCTMNSSDVHTRTSYGLGWLL